MRKLKNQESDITCHVLLMKIVYNLFCLTTLEVPENEMRKLKHEESEKSCDVL